MLKRYLWISLPAQRLELIDHGRIVSTYPVSTAKNGAGERLNSECTPRGQHCIRAKIGSGMPILTVFSGRRPTGEVYSSQLAGEYPDRDWILTRILWLGGLEPGYNRYGNVDTGRRFIYIHGSPDHCVTGVPDSHGCIRMKNSDIIELFDLVESGTMVLIG